MTVLDRRAWLAGTAASLAFGGRALAQSAPVVHIAGAKTEGLCEAYYAEELGYFKRAGLNAEVRVLPSAAPIAPAVASGDLQIGAGNALTVAAAHAHGIPFVVVACQAIHDKRWPNSGLVVALDSPVRSAKDLSGKSVGVSTLNGNEQLAGTALIATAGGDVSTVKFVEISPPLIVPALTAGRLDAAVLAEPQLSAARDRTRSLGSGDDAIGEHSVSTIWYALRSWLDANKATARTFADAVYAAGAWANANPEKAALVLHKYIGLDEPRALAHFAPRQDAAGLQVLFDAAAKYRFIPPVVATDFVWDGK